MHLSGRARLVEFSFTSILAAGVDGAELLRLARQAWRHNLRAGLTGRLGVEGRVVDQVLEGPEAEIMALSARVLTDRRHGAIRVRALGALRARRFDCWTLEGLAPAEITAPARSGARALPCRGEGARALRLLTPVEAAATACAAPRAALRGA